MKQIVVITTGGTIAMKENAQVGGAVPTLVGSELSAALPQDLARVRTIEFLNLPSAHLTIEQLWGLSRLVAQTVEDRAVQGVVVTHGTDTLEESAYLCDLTIDSEKPVVFTGSMRAASEQGYEGVANLTAAVRVAADSHAAGLGTVVVFNDEIFSACDVTKTRTTLLDAFQSSEWGPLGRVDLAGVVIARKPLDREFIPARRLEPDVHLIKIAVGMGTEVLSYLSKRGARGIVLEALGGGRVPPWWLPEIERAIRKGIPVVVTSRVGGGRVVDSYGYSGAHRDLVRLGCWFAGGLNGQKARIKLMAALGTKTPSEYFLHR